jgi:arabinosaccharide transport system substrate-binding protein
LTFPATTAEVAAATSKAAAEASSEATSEAAEAATSTDATDNGDVSVIGSNDASATVLEHWTFTELFTAFYKDMVEEWNKENPDKLIRINVHVLPYDDMHNKLQIALNSGVGAPDTVDIEVSKFSNFTEGDVQLLDMTKYADPYKQYVVSSRLQLFSRDGKLYGCPTHVGATVAFYNEKLLSAAGIDYTKIKTWDDFKEAGSKYYAATGKSFANLDTGTNMFFNVLLAQVGGDYIGTDGKLSVNNSGVAKAMQLMKDLQDANAVSLVPGGNPDSDEGYAAYDSGDFAVMIMPLWMSNRWINYMKDQAGNIAVAPVPVIDENTKVLSVCNGGTGTAVVKTSKNADIAAQFIAFAKLSEYASTIQWNTLGNDPCNMSVWDDTKFTNNPDNKFLQYYATNPFDTLKAVKDGIVILNSQATKYYPSISNTFNTEVFNAVFENGDDIQSTLDMAQDELSNEFSE